MVVAGLSAYHDTLESEMQIIPNGQSDYSADMAFKLSGEIRDVDDGKIYKIDTGKAYQSLLFILDNKIYSILTVQVNGLVDANGHTNKQNEFMWLDAENLTPEGSTYKGTDTIIAEDLGFKCNVYEYISPTSGQTYTYYIGIDKPLIYKIECQIHGLAYVEPNSIVTNMAITAKLYQASVIEGDYEAGETGDIQSVQMEGKEKIRMNYTYEDAVTNNYSANLNIKTISNNKFLTNTFINAYEMYKEFTLTLDKNSNTDEQYLKIYVPCTDGGHLGNDRYYEIVDDKIISIRYSHSVNYAYTDKDLTTYEWNYTINSIYDETGKTLEKITIEGSMYQHKYTYDTPYVSNIEFNFESTGADL